MRTGSRVAVALLAAALAATGLGACNRGTSGGGDGRLQAVAGFAVLAEAADRVGGDRLAVTNLTAAGAEPHDLELTTDQVDRIEDADLVVYLGRGFQPAVERAARRSDATRLDLLAGDTGDDPHVWLDPQAMVAIVERLRKALTDLEPASAASFRRNAAVFTTELEQLDADYEAGLADCDRRVIVTAHEAFGRLAARYRLTEVAITGLVPESEPEPRRLAELAAKVRAQGVTTVFTERLVSPRTAETLAREAGVRTAVLDPIEGLPRGAAGGGDYLSLMRSNLAALRLALGCR